jgi:cytochrome c oxidase subunit II
VWDEPPLDPATVARGERLYTSQGCNGCHSTDGSRRAGPTLLGAYGTLVELSDGRVVDADAEYLRASIVDPTRDVVKGYVPSMPSYQGRISDEDLAALVQWLQSLE